MMEWKSCYLDLSIVPLSLLMSVGYHGWLCYKIRTRPMQTVIGINASVRRIWVNAIVKDGDKKAVLAVQSLRNSIMGATLMATTCVLLCCGLGAVISSTYSVKKPVVDSVFGAHGEFMLALKYVTLLVLFLFAFMCYSLSIRFITMVNYQINVLYCTQYQDMAVSIEYVAELLDKSSLLNTVGNRVFYAGIPLLLWIFGPVMVFLFSAALIPVLYNLDIVLSYNYKSKKGIKSLEGGGGAGKNACEEGNKLENGILMC